VKSGETLEAMLLSEINIAYCERLMQDIGDAISKGTFESFRDRTRAEWAKGDIAPR
jgi:queuine tRNA-ribosyltransferase